MAEEDQAGRHRLFMADVPTTNSIKNTTSDNFGLGSSLALRLVSDIGGEGKDAIAAPPGRWFYTDSIYFPRALAPWPAPGDDGENPHTHQV